jgi:hypothetical protein
MKTKIIEGTILIVIIGLFGIYFWTIIKKELEEPHKPVYLKLVEQDFHEDFDSTYVIDGIRTDTFKLKHKCKAN